MRIGLLHISSISLDICVFLRSLNKITKYNNNCMDSERFKVKTNSHLPYTKRGTVVAYRPRNVSQAAFSVSFLSKHCFDLMFALPFFYWSKCFHLPNERSHSEQ